MIKPATTALDAITEAASGGNGCGGAVVGQTSKLLSRDRSDWVWATGKNNRSRVADDKASAAAVK